MREFRYILPGVDGEQAAPQTAPVGELVAAFLNEQGTDALMPVPVSLYLDGFAAILNTAARSSTVLDEDSVLLAVE